MIIKYSSKLVGSVLERRIPVHFVPTARAVSTSSIQWINDQSSSRETQPGPSTAPSSSSMSAPEGPPKSFEEARASAWYLDDEPPSSSSASSSNPPSTFRQPRFTTFDPSRTTTSSDVLPIQPLHPSAPDWLKPLYEYMTTEAGDVLETHTISFMPTLSSPSLRDKEEEIRVETGQTGPLWDWVVVGVVKGTGKGVVGRADRAMRKYIRDNPSLGHIEAFTNRTRKTALKFPRIAEDSDWSLIGIPNKRLCINLFTAEGRERWDLEELWTGKSSIDQRIREDDQRIEVPIGQTEDEGLRPSWSL